MSSTPPNELQLPTSNEAIVSIQGARIVDAKGIYDVVARSESAALAMQDKEERRGWGWR